MRYRILLLATSVLLILAGDAGAEPVDLLGKTLLTPSLEALFDPEGQWDVTDVASPAMSEAFQPTLDMPQYTGVFWVRVTVRNETEDPDWVLVDALVTHDRIDLHRLIKNEEGGSRWTRSDVGRLTPTGQREIRDRHYVLPVRLERGEPATLYVKVEGRVGTRFILQSHRSFLRDSRDEQLLLGAFYGIVLVMALYHLFLYAGLRDVAYPLLHGKYSGTNGFWSIQNGSVQSERRGGAAGDGVGAVDYEAVLLGGAIEVESEVGVGSTFTVRVPRAHDAA